MPGFVSTRPDQAAGEGVVDERERVWWGVVGQRSLLVGDLLVVEAVGEACGAPEGSADNYGHGGRIEKDVSHFID